MFTVACRRRHSPCVAATAPHGVCERCACTEGRAVSCLHAHRTHQRRAAPHPRRRPQPQPRASDGERGDNRHAHTRRKDVCVDTARRTLQRLPQNPREPKPGGRRARAAQQSPRTRRSQRRRFVSRLRRRRRAFGRGDVFEGECEGDARYPAVLCKNQQDTDVSLILFFFLLFFKTNIVINHQSQEKRGERGKKEGKKSKTKF